MSREVVFGDGRTAVLAGGLTPGDLSTSDVLGIDTRTGAITRMTQLRQELHDSSGALVAGRPTVLGGGAGTELSGVEQYGADRRWHVVGHLPGPRSDLSVVASARGFLVIGGYDGSVARREVLTTVDGRSFRRYALLRVGVRYTAAVALGGSVWLFGGEDRNRELPTIQRIDLTSGVVTSVGRLPVGLGHAAVAAVGAKLLIMGGRTSLQHTTAKMWWFDPTTHQVSDAGRLPYPVADAGVLSEPSGVYLLGGETPAYTKQVIRIRFR